MFEKNGKYFADWRTPDGKRHRRSFATAIGAKRHQTKQKALAPREARSAVSVRKSQGPRAPIVRTLFAGETHAVVLTISDRCSHGVQEDRSGPAVVELLESAGANAVVRETLPDDLESIAAALRRHAAAGASLIVTTGGTGLAARDVTPEATRLVCERLVDGLAERMRAEGLRHTPMAALSRGVCGTLSNRSKKRRRAVR